MNERREHSLAIRRLLPADAGAYRTLMLDAYQSYPDAFTSTVAERAAPPIAWWESRLSEGARPTELVVGAFAEGTLAGVAGLSFETREKTQHKSTLFGMFVRPAFQHGGVGRSLVLAALAHARDRPGIKLVQLTVTDGNERARALYAECGFVPFGLEPMAAAVDPRAVDTRYVAKVHMWCDLTAPGQRR